MENVIEITSSENNIQKDTLESDDFKHLIISRVEKANRILNNSNR